MQTYMIDGAIERTGYGPTVEFDLAYIDDYSFHAENDQQALAVVEKMQADHDRLYDQAGAGRDDVANAPSYAASLFRLDSEGEAIKVL